MRRGWDRAEGHLAAAAAGVLLVGLLALPRVAASDAVVSVPAAAGEGAATPSPLAPDVGSSSDAAVVTDPATVAASPGPAPATPAAGDAEAQPAGGASPDIVLEPTEEPAAVQEVDPAIASGDTSAATSAADPRRPASWSVDVHAGLGVWIDVFDWSVSHGGPSPTVTTATIDELAAHGVDTIYLQTARVTAPDAVLEPDRLQALIDRAHEHDLAVVAWYLPTFVDLDDDWRRIEAAMGLDVDGFALDIESQEVEDPDERSRRLLELSQRLRALAGDRVLVANVLPPVALEEIATGVWPRFPWVEVGALYDVFMPMAYFTFRSDESPWRDAEAYTAENIRRIRTNSGDPGVPVHLIGGIADRTTVADVEGMTRGALDAGAIGLSLYDVATTGDDLWAPMQAWRELS